MNKYERELENLRAEREQVQQDLADKIAILNSNEVQYCNMANSQITIINVERHLMRKEINALYKFLKQFGNVGKKITPFEFVAEDWLFPDPAKNQRVKEKRNNPLDFSLKSETPTAAATTAFLGASALTGAFGVSSLAGTASMAASAATASLAMPLFAPMALPAYMLISGFKKRTASKEALMEETEEYEEERIAYGKAIASMNDRLSYLESTVQIANMYRVLIAEIRDTIEEKIIPELNGILAFLYADAIKNCIINNEDPSTAKISNIAEYRGTPYETHYQFIKNTFDYYTLICKFFSDPVLTNLLQGGKVSETQKKHFMKKLKGIGDQQLQLLDSSSLGGEQQ